MWEGRLDSGGIVTNRNIDTDVTTPAELRKLLAEAGLLLAEALAGYSYDPGFSYLDDEQPINVRLTLGWYRRVKRTISISDDDIAALRALYLRAGDE
jgi:hypothetical protein